MAHKGQENLIPFNERTEEEQREIARQGGIASGKVRQEKATMRKTLEMLLDETNKKGVKYRDLATLGLIKGAIDGKAENYKIIAQMLGELGQTEVQATIDWTPLADLIKITPEEEKENESNNQL